MSDTVRGMANAAAPDRRPDDPTIFPSTVFESAAPTSPEEDDYIPEILEGAPAGRGFERARPVSWAANDLFSPCYSHLLVDGGDAVQGPKAFEFGKAEFDLLLKANRFAPKGHYDVVAFGLRGARLKGAEKFELVDRVPLVDARPDHQHYQCVIGYYFRNLGKFSASTGSTVPWHQYMSAGKLAFNLLPPGCYIYKKGDHRPQTESRWVVPALRLSDANGSESGEVTVLRTKKDAIFDFADDWSRCKPSDNIHCAYSNSKFSSLGCQTIKGGMHDGHWVDFQATIRTLPTNARVDYVLLTGSECAIAWSLLSSGTPPADAEVQRRLGRLRAGSEGAEVSRLQAALEIPDTGYFGASTKERLAAVQAAKQLPPDGVYSPVIEAKLGWSVFESGAEPNLTVAALAPDSLSGSRVSAEAATHADASNSGAIARDALRKIAARPSNASKAQIWDRYVAVMTSPDGARVLDEYGLLENPQRLVFILANMLAETGGLSLVWENMGYSAPQLLKIFGRAANISPAEAERLAFKPEAIAERVYGLGNPRKARELGNKDPGDGWRFRGGGFLQTTGRFNYRTLGERIGEDLESRPELIEDPLVSLKAACAEWKRGGLNDYADQGSFRACCNGINYGNPKRKGDPIGFDHRLRYLKSALDALGLPPPKRAAGALEAARAGEDALELGDIGPDVEKLQRGLNALGYDAGEPDGSFTTRTRDAVLRFQARNGLTTSGDADWETLTALSSEDAIAEDADAAGAARGRRPHSKIAPTEERGSGLALAFLLAAVLGLLLTMAANGLLGPALSEWVAVNVPSEKFGLVLALGGWLAAVFFAAVGLLSGRER